MASGLEFLGRDRPEPDAVAGADREISLVQVDDAQGRPAEQVPAAGRFGGIDPRLAAGDRHRAGRHAEPRRIATRQAGQCVRQVAGIREARLEADREDVVLDPGSAARSPRRGSASNAPRRFPGRPRRTGPGSPAACRRPNALAWGRPPDRWRGGGIPDPSGRHGPDRRTPPRCDRRARRRSRPASAGRAPARPSRRHRARRRSGPGRRDLPAARARSGPCACGDSFGYDGRRRVDSSLPDSCDEAAPAMTRNLLILGLVLLGAAPARCGG